MDVCVYGHTQLGGTLAKIHRGMTSLRLRVSCWTLVVVGIEVKMSLGTLVMTSYHLRDVYVLYSSYQLLSSGNERPGRLPPGSGRPQQQFAWWIH